MYHSIDYKIAMICINYCGSLFRNIFMVEMKNYTVEKSEGVPTVISENFKEP